MSFDMISERLSLAKTFSFDAARAAQISGGRLRKSPQRFFSFFGKGGLAGRQPERTQCAHSPSGSHSFKYAQ